MECLLQKHTGPVRLQTRTIRSVVWSSAHKLEGHRISLQLHSTRGQLNFSIHKEFLEQLQNIWLLIYMSLNKNSVYCVRPRSSKPPDTCKWDRPKWPGILKFSWIGSNCRILGHSFTYHWIRIASIVLGLDLQSLPHLQISRKLYTTLSNFFIWRSSYLEKGLGPPDKCLSS